MKKKHPLATLFLMDQNPTLLIQEDGEQHLVAQLIPPQKPFDHSRKVSCPSCQTSHVIVIRNLNEPLPKAVACGACQKPIYLNDFQQRSTRREKIKKEIQVTHNSLTLYKAEILDFSPAGMRIRTSQKMNAKDPIRVFCPDFEASGEIVWAKKVGAIPPLYELGVRFDSFNSQNKSTVIHKIV